MAMESKALNRTVRITLSDAEVQVRVSNLTLKNLLVLAWNFAEKNKKIQGALNLAKALKKTRDIRVFTMTPAQFQQFHREARQRKILCSYVWDKSGRAKSVNIDVLLPATELKQASLIFKQMAYGLTDVRDVKTSEQTPPQPETDRSRTDAAATGSGNHASTTGDGNRSRTDAAATGSGNRASTTGDGNRSRTDAAATGNCVAGIQPQRNSRLETPFNGAAGNRLCGA